MRRTKPMRHHSAAAYQKQLKRAEEEETFASDNEQAGCPLPPPPPSFLRSFFNLLFGSNLNEQRTTHCSALQLERATSREIIIIIIITFQFEWKRRKVSRVAGED